MHVVLPLGMIEGRVRHTILGGRGLLLELLPGSNAAFEIVGLDVESQEHREHH
jgi:hypothetical protein